MAVVVVVVVVVVVDVLKDVICSVSRWIKAFAPSWLSYAVILKKVMWRSSRVRRTNLRSCRLRCNVESWECTAVVSPEEW